MNVLILCGEGLNCENESARAFHSLGFKTQFIPARKLMQDPQSLLSAEVFVIPGGFSWGDEWGSGQLLSTLLFKALREKGVWEHYLQQKKCVLGICNGFQTLIKAGVFEKSSTKRELSLTYNSPHGFQDRWVELEVLPSPCLWTKGLEGTKGFMPIRHGEGRIVRLQDSWNGAYPVLKYTRDVNGSFDQVAALTDCTGQILGLMPHPEAALDEPLIPMGLESALPQKIFTQISTYVKETFYVH
jgi:phosphoribosylformylglycinamidine (FGAM) synthase-like amidotransferase family enzyme